MKKTIITKALAAALVSSVFLTACGRDMVSTAPGMINNGLISSASMQNVRPANLDNIDTAIDFATGTKPTFNNTNLQIYIDGPQGFPAMERAILSAKKTLYLEFFIFENDYTGRKFADALIKKAKEGVDVRFLYDFVGNSNVKLMNYMAQNGVQVETFNKGVLTKSGTNITHRKIVMVDGRYVLTGGMNIGDRYATGEWHDIMIGFEGEAVKEILKEFMYNWKKAGGKYTPDMNTYLNQEVFVPAGEKTFPLRVTVTSPHEANKKEDIKRMFMAAIDSAKDNIKVAMPYFSDDEFIERLIMAQKRGVKVTAIIPKKADMKIIDQVSLLTANQLIQGGVQVYLGGAKNSTFNHSKVISVDNIWSTVGSCNADYRAFHINQELNVGISDPEFTAELNSRFFDFHIRNSELAVYKKIPWYKKPYYSFLEGMDNLI